MDVRWASAAFMIQVLMVKINGNKMSGMMSFLDNMTKSMYYPVFDSSKKKNVSNLQCLCGIRDVFYC